jgi:2-oxoglutarate dehydrogenase E1 component
LFFPLIATTPFFFIVLLLLKVILLPHGYDGQGPEHSSARLERYLQLTDCDPDDVVIDEDPELTIQRHNMQVLNCTLPGNYFHALRRQIHRKFRKPLVVMTPKNLLKLRESTSRLEEIVGPTRFQRVIGEVDTSLAPKDKIRRLIFCSGKVYFDLVQARTEKKIKDIAIVRVEQLSPFPFKEIVEQSAAYPNAEIVWVQEEHKNMGAWSWIAPYFRSALKPQRGSSFFPRYIGRPVGAATATGYLYEHTSQLHTFLTEAFS